MTISGLISTQNFTRGHTLRKMQISFKNMLCTAKPARNPMFSCQNYVVIFILYSVCFPNKVNSIQLKYDFYQDSEYFLFDYALYHGKTTTVKKEKYGFTGKTIYFTIRF